MGSLVRVTWFGVLLSSLLGAPSLAASPSSYAIRVRRHWQADTLTPDEFREILRRARRRLCEACGQGPNCPIAIEPKELPKNRIEVFQHRFLPRPVISIRQGARFLHQQPVFERRWRQQGREFPLTVYLIDSFEPEPGYAEHIVQGLTRTSGKMILLALKSTEQRGEKWYELEASMLAHELGHHRGLGHVDAADNVMHCTVSVERNRLETGQCDAFLWGKALQKRAGWAKCDSNNPVSRNLGPPEKPPARESPTLKPEGGSGRRSKGQRSAKDGGPAASVQRGGLGSPSGFCGIGSRGPLFRWEAALHCLSMESTG